jgi:hypothetical protein
MRFVPLLMAVLGFALAARADPQADPATTPAEAVAPGAAGGALEPVYVAPTQLDRIGRLMAPVYINGQGPYAFVIDTGASRSVIAPHIAVALGLQPDPLKSLELRGVTGAEVVPSVYVDRLEAGEIVLRKQHLPVVTPSVFADADGILGVEGFAHMCVHADFVEKSIAILKNGCPRTSDLWARARAKLRFGGLLTVNARMRGPSRVAAIIDTGAERSLGNLPLLRALDLEQAAENPANATSVFGATSHRANGHLLQTPRIFLGELEIADLKVTFGDFDVFRLWGLDEEPALVVVMDVLCTGSALMIDYRRSELRVLPRGVDSEIKITPAHPGRLP